MEGGGRMINMDGGFYTDGTATTGGGRTTRIMNSVEEARFRERRRAASNSAGLLCFDVEGTIETGVPSSSGPVTLAHLASLAREYHVCIVSQSVHVPRRNGMPLYPVFAAHFSDSMRHANLQDAAAAHPRDALRVYVSARPHAGEAAVAGFEFHAPDEFVLLYPERGLVL